MQPWTRVEPTKVTEVGYRTVVTKHFRAPDGKVYEFGTYDKEDIIYTSIIALTNDTRVVIAEQFRVGPEKIYQELPGGAVDDGESSVDAALRELKEETGYTSDSEPIFLGATYKNAYTNGVHHYYFVEGCSKTTSQELDEGEFVLVKEITIQELIDNAMNDRVSDALAVFYALDRLKGVLKS